MSCDKLVIWGSPQKVADELLAFREEIGDFGTLLYAGKDWLDRDLGRRSMVLMAEKVMPAVNTAIAARKAAESRSRLGQSSALTQHRWRSRLALGHRFARPNLRAGALRPG